MLSSPGIGCLQKSVSCSIRKACTYHNHTGLRGRLASNLGSWILLQAGIKDSIRDLIGHLIWVALSDTLGGEAAIVFSKSACDGPYNGSKNSQERTSRYFSRGTISDSHDEV